MNSFNTVATIPFPENLPPYIVEILTMYPELTEANRDCLSGLERFTLTNADFTEVIFPKDVAGSFWAAGFPGDPANGKWNGMPAQNCKLPWCIMNSHNNFIDTNVYKPGTDGKIHRKNECFAACHLVVIDDVGTKV